MNTCIKHKEKGFEICLKDGCIESTEIIFQLQEGQTDYNTGAYNMFLGQVRQDSMAGKVVLQIEYSAYSEMAIEALQLICKESLTKFNLTYITIIHSLGKVNKGEICLFVMVRGRHRKECFDACQPLIERIKKEVPIWGKEIFEDNTHSWKINKF